MKTFASPSFFRVFDVLLSSTNPGLKLARWSIDGVECERDRHSFTSPKYGLTIEVFTLTRPGKGGWSLTVVKEYWWSGAETNIMRMPHWAKLNAGQRSDVFVWLRRQEAALEARSGRQHEPTYKE